MIQNVLDHDADPTGILDSTAAFYAALEALSEAGEGGIIQIPAGHYLIAGGPILLDPSGGRPMPKAVIFAGEGGVGRTALPIPGGIIPHGSGSATTLIFPLESDGFIIDIPGVTFENLAIVRGYDIHFLRDESLNKYERRGIYSTKTLFARNVYLLRWNRAIDLDGRRSEARNGSIPNVNLSRLENIVAEDCYWATYVRGYDAQGGRFSYIFAANCQAGIYDSSLAGNGYSDCYVESVAGNVGVPYYIDNTSQLRNCRFESSNAAQIARSAQVVGGTFLGPVPNQYPPDLPIVDPTDPTPSFFKSIVGIPGKVDSFSISALSFDKTERLAITIDRHTPRIVEFPSGLYDADTIAEIINLTFADLGPVASVDVFDQAISIQGFVPYGWGKVSIAEIDGGDLLDRLSLPISRRNDGIRYAEGEGLERAQILMAGEYSGIAFKGNSGLGLDYEQTQLLEVQIAPRGDTVMLWQARGFSQETLDYGLVRIYDPGIRRWAFALGSSSSLGATLAFTHYGDRFGHAQTIAYNGLWLMGNPPGLPPVLICNGSPSPDQGQLNDLAWDMSANPPQRYIRRPTGWELG